MNAFAGEFDRAFDDAPAIELSQVITPLSESDRERLTDFWSRVIAECGADLPSREVSARPARRARRVQRQRTVRLVRVLTTAQPEAVSPGSAVAA